MNLVSVILCGGSGSRLWPVSRELHPKPLIRLKDGQSLIQKAFLRGARLTHCKEVLTVTRRELLPKIEDDYAELDQSDIERSFILEPCGRNTAPAIALAALQIERRHGRDALILVLAADHLIQDETAFALACDAAANLAQQGLIATLGITPQSAHTGYGYIEAEGNRVLRFVEKPGREVAEGYVASGRFYWNAGIFCFQAGTILDALQSHHPELMSACRLAFAQATVQSNRLLLDAKSFERVPEGSIDYAVMEKSDAIAVVPCAIGWNDIGCWNAMGELVDQDAAGNRIEGTVELHDVRNCAIHGHTRMVGAVGLDNLLVVDTPDALLIADRSRTQDVKRIYGALKVRGHDSYKHHVTEHRPWGSHTILEEGPNFRIKRLVVKPGQSMSMQVHYHRSEHWIVVSGMAKVENGEETRLVETNESTFIKAGQPHRVENPGKLELVMIEVQSGQYLGEDDIVRFEAADSRDSR